MKRFAVPPARRRRGVDGGRSSSKSVAALVLAAGFTSMPALATEYSLATGQTAVGENTHYTVRRGDVFADIARRFDLGYTELAAANPGINPWVPPPGTVITIPTLHVLPDVPRQGIVINLAQSRLYYFPAGGERVETYPITIGFIGKNTPVGVTRIVNKEANPTWYPPASIRREEPELPAAVPPGPDNPLGAYAMHLGWKGYLVHGTNKPDSIGRTVSHGCIRLYPEDIVRLFGEVGVGTTVRTVQQPATAGWQGDTLYVQVAPSKEQAEAIDTEQPVERDPLGGVETLVSRTAGGGSGINWDVVDRAADRRDSIAVKVADRSAGYSASSASSTRQDLARTETPPPDLPAFDPEHETHVFRPIVGTTYDAAPAYAGSAYAGSAYAASAYAGSPYPGPAYGARAYDAPPPRASYVRSPADDDTGNSPLYGVLPYGTARYRGPAYDTTPDRVYGNPAYDTPAYSRPGYEGSDAPTAGPQKLYSNWYGGR